MAVWAHEYPTVRHHAIRPVRSATHGERAEGEADARVRAAIITPRGKAMTDAVDAARERRARALLAD